MKVVYGTRGMVVSCHPQATAAGWAALRDGGSVADAAIAAAGALAVVMPQSCTIGGDAFILHHDAKSGRTTGINASGRSPALADGDRFADGMAQTGPLSCSVPGVVGGWQALHDRFGRLPWKSLLDRAVELADDGFAASAGIAAASVAQRDKLAGDPGSAAIFLKDGMPIARGARLRQPALARTLRAIATGGAAAFYDGGPAASIGRYIGDRGGILAATDMAGYAPEIVTPIDVAYRDHVVRVMPPNSYGLYMLLQLKALQTVDIGKLGLDSPDRLTALVAAAHAAFAAGERAIADPQFGPDAVADVLGPAGTARLLALFAERGGSKIANQGGTAVVSVADADGNGCIIVQSVFLLFGSGVTDPESGVHLHCRMYGFTAKPGHPNRIAPRKRPAHTLNPVMVVKGDRLRFILGTPGGPGQTITLTQVLSNRLDLGLSLVEAVGAPRWSMDFGSASVAEATLSPALVAELARRGIRLVPAPPSAPFFGSAQLIEVLPERAVSGIADPRREAMALGL